jgi:hypothetical protein
MHADPLGTLVAYSLALGGLILAAAIKIAQSARATEPVLSADEQAKMSDAELADESALLADQLWWRLEGL